MKSFINVLKKRINSFAFALNGLKIVYKEEANAKIHLTIGISVIFAGFFLDICAFEWIAITFAIGIVIALEIVNTAIENIADYLTLENNIKIKKIKDISAAAVLVATITAVIVGLIIFTPKIINCFHLIFNV